METNDYMYLCYKYEEKIRVEKWNICRRVYIDGKYEYVIVPSFNAKTKLREILIVYEEDLCGNLCQYAFSAKCVLLKYIMSKNNTINNIMQKADDIKEVNWQIEELYKEIKEAKKELEKYL